MSETSSKDVDSVEAKLSGKNITQLARIVACM